MRQPKNRLTLQCNGLLVQALTSLSGYLHPLTSTVSASNFPCLRDADLALRRLVTKFDSWARGYSGIAQLAEFAAVNRVVVGSSPTPGANSHPCSKR